MTLSQLRTFLAIADLGSVHAAADHLFVTQSAVSTSLATLQRSLGIRLVQREGRGLRLTEAGVIYADYIRRALGLLDEAITAAAARADPERGLLRLAAVTTAGEQILPTLLASFRQVHPHVGIQVKVGNRQRVRALLDRREVDLLLSGRPAPNKEIAVLGIRPHELIIVAPPSALTQFAARDPIGWADQQTWLLREKGSGTRDITEKFLAMLDLPHTPKTLTVGSNAAIRQAVIAGLGATLISRDAVSRELHDGTLVEVRLPGTPLPRDWHLIANPGTLPRTAQALVDHVLAIGEFHRPQQKPDWLPSRLGSNEARRPRPELALRVRRRNDPDAGPGRPHGHGHRVRDPARTDATTRSIVGRPIKVAHALGGGRAPGLPIQASRPPLPSRQCSSNPLPR